MDLNNQKSLLESIAKAEARLKELDDEKTNVAETLARLRNRLVLLSETQVVKEQTLQFYQSVTKDSPPEDKIRLFRSLFRGRDDVYPRFWESKKTGKKGYSPVCKNEWKKTLCSKPKVKCSDCPNRDFDPVTDKVIRDHLEGKITIGIYPLLKDETCYFLAVDFDKKSWIEDSLAFLETCSLFQVPAALERSRSSKGGHVWIFFESPVSSSIARQLGCHLLTETMSRHHQLGMDSYDRLFPNQDTMPKGGFGNLISLPLQQGPRELGNTVFIDKNSLPLPDQWAYLCSLERMAPAIVTSIAREASQSGRVVDIPISSSGDEDKSCKKPPKVMRQIKTAEPLPKIIHGTYSNLIYLKKKGVPSALLNQLKRLAAFQNPEFYRRQKMRLSIAQTPRVIYCAEELPSHLALPRGCLDEIQDLLNENGIRLNLVDERNIGKPIYVSFQGDLNPDQQVAVKRLLEYDIGILVAPPGTGKTIVGIYLIGARDANTLVLVHRKPLLEQWKIHLSTFLKIEPKKIGQIGGGKQNRSGVIDVAMLQSLFRKGKVKDIIGEYGYVIVDECHHVSAFSFEQVLWKVKAKYVTGLTSTPYRRDGHQPIIAMQCGPVRYTVKSNHQSAKQIINRRVIFRKTDFCILPSSEEIEIHTIYANMASDKRRNQLIFEDVLAVLEEGRSPIILTERKDHLEVLAQKLNKFTKNLIVLQGGMRIKKRREMMQQLASIPKDKERVLLATGRYIGEGFDDSRLDTLFLAMPVSWKGILVQYAGRLHRIYAGKREVRVYDYVDQNIPMLMRMYEKRLKGYRAMGYTIVE